MEFRYSFSELEKIFPVSFAVDRQGSLVQMSQGFKVILSEPSVKYDFNQIFKLKNNLHFSFSFDFYKFNEGYDFVFECSVDGKEYCFASVYNEASQTLLFSARVLYADLLQKALLSEYYKSIATFPEDNPNPVLRLSYYGQVIYSNKAANEAFGNFEELVLKHEHLNREFKRVVTEKISVSTEFTFYDKVYAAQVVALKERNYINIFLNDITQEKLNFKLAQEERAQKIMAAKLSTLGEMASGIAHEINNPLTIMMGRLDLVKKLLQNQDLNLIKESIEKSLDVVMKSSKRISYIIKGLRNFSRNGDKDPMDKVVVEQIVDDVLMLTSEKLKKSNVNFKVDVPVGLDFECRSVQIEQVIVNLIHNSFDAIENLEEKWISMKVFSEGINVVFEITDSGGGISKELQEKMLQPFFTTKDVGKGTGLGLSISLGLIESHGGRLFYKQDSPNTCFRFEFPRYQGLYLKSA